MDGWFMSCMWCLNVSKIEHSPEEKRDGVECLIKGVVLAKILCYSEIVVWAGCLIQGTGWVPSLINIVVILY